MIHNPELDLAWNFVEKTDRNIFLTGKAGTGKTTFLHKIKDHSFKRLVVVAPTGVAAINAKGVTIHSFFQMPFGPILPEESEQGHHFQHKKTNPNPRFQRKFNKKKIDIIRSLDLLIIDEISMVRADLLDGIDQVLRRYKNKNQVFGGTQVLMIGDLQQLAPVVKPDEWLLLKSYYKSPFFFNSRAFQESIALSIELKHIYRQDNEHFIGILNEIRNNKLSQNSLLELNKRFNEDFTPEPDQGYITLTTHNNRADRMNDKELGKIKRKSWFFKAKILDDFPEYAYPTDERLELKIGAQVMFIKNDSSPEKRYYNGKIGKVVQLDNHEVVVRCPGDTHDITSEREIWENIKYNIDKESKEIKEKMVGSFSQIPLRLAWAITIHKSQGLTFEKAIIDAASSFAHGQTYVALSRCKTLEGIVLKSPINQKGIIQDSRVISFTQNVEEHQPDHKNLSESQKNYQLNLIAELFNYKQLPFLVNRCNKIIYESGNSLQGNYMEPLKIIKTKGVQELVGIADSFQRQLVQMSIDIEDPAKNKPIQLRISKAISYFAKHTQEFILKPLHEISFSTDNKAIKKDFKELLAKIEESIRIKMYLFDHLIHGFQTAKYLELRAKAILEKPQKESTKIERDNISVHPELFKLLRKLRNQFAKDLDIDHFQIFSQKTLFEICETLPVSLQQLKKVKGMGKVRVTKYGNEIIEIIKSYCQDNKLQQNEDIIEIPKKKTSKKGETQKITLEMFKAGKSIDEIAKERDYVKSTIEGHLSGFIKTGEIKLEELMDIKKAKKLIKLIINTHFEGLNDLRTKLDGNYSYGELRIVVNAMEKEKG